MPIPYITSPTFKVLVIDDTDETANTVASVLARGSCEIISCRDMALAEVATDLTEFDLILVAPDSSGVNGIQGLAVADFLVGRNPRATTVLMLPEEDADLKAVVAQNRSVQVVSKPLRVDELLHLSVQLGLELALSDAAAISA